MKAGHTPSQKKELVLSWMKKVDGTSAGVITRLMKPVWFSDHRRESNGNGVKMIWSWPSGLAKLEGSGSTVGEKGGAGEEPRCEINPPAYRTTLPLTKK